jgi:NitT/TauT family transport system substrate-binding protein
MVRGTFPARLVLGLLLPLVAVIAATAGPLAAGSPAAGASQPTLPTTPVVNLKVGALPVSAYGAHYIAQERGYFRDVGLNVEFESGNSVNDLLPALAQGQIHVSGCSSNVFCFNFLNRRADLQIVADVQSAGRTERSIGSTGLVVRQDLWENGTLREPRDFVGRTIHVIVGPGSGSHGQAARWFRRNGVDPLDVEFVGMPFPDQLLAISNHAIESSIQTEPLLTAGLSRGVHHLVATQEEMHPTTQILYVLFWTGIERMGPMVGERWMVAYLRGVRDYLNAFEYGVDQDAIIEIMTRNTAIRDPDIYRQTRYAYVDPNGLVQRATLESDTEVFRELGMYAAPIDLSQAFEDKYRQFAVQYLGEYRPPR